MACMVLFAPTPPDLSAFGVRALSAYLREQGHRTRLVFLPGSIGRLRPDGAFAYRYPDTVLDRAAELCAGFDLAGVSFMTPYFDRAAQLTERIRKTGAPVIWGGIHPTVRPEEALEHADFVCVGEGERALDALLVQGCAGPPVRGIWSRMNGGRDNGTTPLCPDLDRLPDFDFSNQDHFILGEDGSQLELDDALLETFLPLVPGPVGELRRAYRTMTDRGCPHNCAYCSVPAVKRRLGDQSVSYFRQRGPERVLNELAAIKDRFPSLEAVQFFDDTFFAKPFEWFEEFAPEYKRRIGLPFYCQASPATLDPGKLDMLLDAGLAFVEMGVQTGSPKMREIFRRRDTDAMVLEGANLLHSRIPRLLPPIYHVITDAPWETEDDLADTARLLARMPKPFGLAVSSLVFFPGTELHARAVREGLVTDEASQVYRTPFYAPPRRTWPGFVLYLLSFQRFPQSWARAFLSPRVTAFFKRADPKWLYKIGYMAGQGARLAGKGFQALSAGDFRRIARWLDKRFTRRFGDSGPAGRMGE